MGPWTNRARRLKNGPDHLGVIGYLKRTSAPFNSEASPNRQRSSLEGTCWDGQSG